MPPQAVPRLLGTARPCRHLFMSTFGGIAPLGLCTLPGSRCVTEADSLCSAGQVGVLSPGAHSSPHRGSLSLDSRKAYTGAHPCSGPNLTQSQAMVQIRYDWAAACLVNRLIPLCFTSLEKHAKARHSHRTLGRLPIALGNNSTPARTTHFH